MTAAPEQHPTPGGASATDWANWRAFLPHLAGLPLLPIGAGQDRKGPVDPLTGRGFVGWPTCTPYSPADLAAMNGHVIAAGMRTGEYGLLIVDVDGFGPRRFLQSIYGAEPLKVLLANTWSIGRTNFSEADHRFKIAVRLTPEQHQRFGGHYTSRLRVDENGAPQPSSEKKLGALEIFYGSPAEERSTQVVVLGEHPKSGGFYSWINTPAQIVDCPVDFLDALLLLKEAIEKNKGSSAATARPASAAWSVPGDWRDSSAARPCPVCGRDHSGACSIGADGMGVWCFHGGTFAPPLNQKPGETHVGRDGRLWAYVRTETHGGLGERSLFRWHTERERPYIDIHPDQQLNRPGASPAAVSGPMPWEAPPAAGEVVAPLEFLKRKAAQLQEAKAPYADRLPLLRAEAKRLRVEIRDQELLAMFQAARRRRMHGSDDPMLRPGDVLESTPEPWAWEGLILRACLNLLIALPKQGKTSLVIAWLAAWHRNELAFLDHNLNGPCPPVLIVGTDQPGADWEKMLRPVGWLDSCNRLGGPLVGLYTKGRPLHLDPEGIDRIAAIAQTHPGLVVLIDSLSECVGPLGLKEESPEIAEPIKDLMEQLEPHRATVVLIHHASKGRAGEGATSASRGSTALPATASQILKLAPLTTNDEDRRRRLTTQGRGGLPQALVIQRDGATWELLDTGAVGREEDATQAAQTLNDTQYDALCTVCERWDDCLEKVTAADMAVLQGGEGNNPERVAMKRLRGLEKRGLLHAMARSRPGQGGKVIEFWPTTEGLAAFKRVRNSPSAPDRGSAGSSGSDGLPSREDPERNPSFFPLSQQPSDPSDPADLRTEALGRSDPNGPCPLAPTVPIGSGADAFDDLDDPWWPKRVDTA
ncbi:AAA family ATPase [Synechococcus sp. CCY 0621]|uniref:AAA family ATPase n=1 Tax=Synechococcus sp. CCY 0621 TaxID=2815603 RepID=UPI001C23A813|nr:AAA family ATPase [Synechococcus sp. CCY 0621]